MEQNNFMHALHPKTTLSRDIYFFSMILVYFSTACIRICDSLFHVIPDAWALDPARLCISLITPVFSPAFSGIITRELVGTASILGTVLLMAAGVYVSYLRMRALKWPEWLCVVAIMPYLAIAFFIAALFPPIPDTLQEHHEAIGLQRFIPRDELGLAIVIAALTALASILFYLCAMIGNPIYGLGLFFALPFAQGMAAAILTGTWGRTSLSACLRVAAFAYLVTAAMLVAFALEGFICILIVSPLAFCGVGLGAVIGFLIQKRGPTQGFPILVIACVLPLILGAEKAEAPSSVPVIAVRSEKIINAPASVVWHNVVAFAALPPPTELPFRVGIAYPERAKIIGQGVGAVRFCIFSTGAFVEPITVWKPNRELSFTVRHTPEPMREWSPYGPLQTPHLTGYFRSLHGQFLLESVGRGRTRLIGTTWYTDNIWPQAYWRLFSDPILHSIHMRVLNQVAVLSEAEATTLK